MAFSAGALGASSFPDGIHYMGGYLNDVTQNTYTFTGVNFGPEDPNREIILAISVNGSNNGVETVTVDGVAVNDSVGNTNSRGVRVARKVHPTGTSGTVVVTGTNTTRCSLFVYRVVRKTSGASSDSQQFITTDQSTSITFNTVTIPSGGVLIGVGNLTETSNVAISGTGAYLAGQTQSTDDTGETDFSFYVDGTNYTTSTTPSITASWSASQFRFAVAAAF